MAENQGGPVQAAPKMKSETGKKSRKRAVAVIIPVLLIALVIAFAVLTVTKNLFGGRDGIIRFLCSMDPAYRA